jgi:DNA-binding FadR family transcriptional regulator
LSIEISSIQLALQNVTNQDLECLDCINEKMLDEPGSNEQFPYNNMEFHVKIAEISGNPLMKLISEAILNILIMLYPNHKSSIEFIRATYKRHNAIIDAMKKKDPELCERFIYEDVVMTKNMFNT